MDEKEILEEGVNLWFSQEEESGLEHYEGSLRKPGALNARNPNVAPLSTSPKGKKQDTQQEVSQFYELPSFAHVAPHTSTALSRTDTSLNNVSVPLLRRIVPLLPESGGDGRQEEKKKEGVAYNAGSLVRSLRLYEIIGWTAHLLQLNKLADDAFVQGLILSVYACGPLYLDVPRIVHFFTQNFSEVPLSYELVWYAPVDEIFCLLNGLQWRQWRGATRRKLIRAVRRREAPGPLLNVLFVALCRVLGLHARLILAVPRSSVVNKIALEERTERLGRTRYTPLHLLSEEDAFRSVCSYLTRPLSRALFQKWYHLATACHLHSASAADSFPNRKQTRKASGARHHAKHDHQARVHRTVWPEDEVVWAEVFWTTARRWIAVNVGTKKFDFAYAKKEGKLVNYKKGVPLSVLSNSAAEVLPIKTVPWKINATATKGHTVNGNDSSNALKQHNSKGASLRHLLLDNDSSDSDSSCSSTEMNVVAQSAALRETEQSVSTSAELTVSATSPMEHNNSFCYVFSDRDQPPSPLREEDKELHRESLACTFAAKRPVSQTISPKNAVIKDSSAGMSLMSRHMVKRQRLMLGAPDANVSPPLESAKHPAAKGNEGFELFVIASNRWGLLRDVTLRYCSGAWAGVVEKRGFLDGAVRELLESWNCILAAQYSSTTGVQQRFARLIAMDRVDDYALQELAYREPLPRAKSGFRCHPRYVLESLLSAHQVIFPREPIVGYFQGEPVFLRKNVHELLSRTAWEETRNRAVIPGEIPLRRKLQKRRKLVNVAKNGQTKVFPVQDSASAVVELYAIWQTQERVYPPQMKNASNDGAAASRCPPIPCSQFGTVNLTGKRLLPTGCVHLKGMPGITYIVRDIGTIPWRPAVVGFEFSGKVKPVIDGVVIWESDKDVVLTRYAAYRQRKLDFGFMRYRGRIRKLWQTLMKTLLGRYYVAMREGSGATESGAMSFRHVKHAIQLYSSEQLNALGYDLPDNDVGFGDEKRCEERWEEI